jgi:hypothetical protein
MIVLVFALLEAKIFELCDKSAFFLQKNHGSRERATAVAKIVYEEQEG